MAKTTSKSKANYFSTYKSTNRCVSNRKRKLEKLLKQQPNNQQIKNALASVVRRRKTPTNSEWSHGNRRLVQLFKYFTGRGDKNLFSSNPKVRSAALSAPPTRVFGELPAGKVSFSLAARAHDKFGNLTWA